MAALRLGTKLLANLEKYGGPKEKFPSFKFSFEACVGSQSETLLDHMVRSETLSAEVSMSLVAHRRGACAEQVSLLRSDSGADRPSAGAFDER